MAQGEPFDGNIGGEVIQLDDVDVEVRPDYVIRATITRDDVRSTLPEIHIPSLNPPMPRFYLGLVIRSVREFVQYSLTPGPEYNPLLSMLAWNADHWSVTFHASGDSLTAAFYPVYINPQPAERVETPRRESSTDDEQPGPSYQVNNRSGGSHMDGSHTDDEQPGPSRRANSSEIRSGASRTPSDQSPGSQNEMRLGAKRKRKTSGSSKSRERKRKRSDHHSDSESSRSSLISGISSSGSLGETSTDDEQPGPSHLTNNSRSEIRSRGSTTPADQSPGSHDEMRQGIKRKRKTSDSSKSRERKRKRSDHDSDSDSSSLSLISGISSPGSLEETSTDDEQPGPSRRANSRSEIRSGGSTTPADQSSGSHDEMRQGVKRKRKTSGPHSPGLKRRASD